MTKTSAAAKREQKLAQKLKENLLRRKAQSRARAATGESKPPVVGADQPKSDPESGEA